MGLDRINTNHINELLYPTLSQLDKKNKKSIAFGLPAGPGCAYGQIVFDPDQAKTLKNKGYKEPTPIQKAAIPELMLGRDLLGQAQTGTGKTAAFALPLLERINSKERRPQVLVLTPTRELAMQVAESFRKYAPKQSQARVPKDLFLKNHLFEDQL